MTEYEEARKIAKFEIADPCNTESNVRVTKKLLQVLLDGPERPTVAYRVKDYADGWILVHTEKEAKREASAGNTIQELVIK